MKHYGDITKIDGSKVEPVWIVTGGSPCQDLSVAGKRAGLDGERSGLFMEQIKIIKEMRANDRRKGRTDELIRPRFMVWENVPGAFSSNKGEDFRIVLEETAKVADETVSIPRPADGKWTPSGVIMGKNFSLCWRTHDAQYWGVPQRRRRISLVADFGGMSAPEILFERESVSRDFEQSRKERQGAAKTAQRSAETTGCTIGGEQITPTLVSGQYKQSGNTQDGLTIVQGIDAYNQAVTGDKAKSLTNKATDSDHIPCVAYGFDPTASRDVGALFLKEKAKTCTVGTCPSHRNGVVTYGLDRASFNQCKNAQFDFAVDEEQIGAMTARGPGAVFNSVVRRLTPLECERLQGFPDGWTDIGDWIDSKGKKHNGDGDSPRYKALGNSIALPFWGWMAERMVNVLREDGVENPTMASLFDGIGGFPLVYSRAGCEPIWASEIEEFPIAVTKMRFGEE